MKSNDVNVSCATKTSHHILCPLFYQLAVMVSTKNNINYNYGLNDCTVPYEFLFWVQNPLCVHH